MSGRQQEAIPTVSLSVQVTYGRGWGGGCGVHPSVHPDTLKEASRHPREETKNPEKQIGHKLLMYTGMLDTYSRNLLFLGVK